MKKVFLIILLSSQLFCFSSFGKEIDLKKFAPTINLFGLHYAWGSQWGGSLDVILRDNFYFDKSSSTPKGYLSKLYDGNPGNINDPTGSFLVFDDSIAAFRIIIPKWRYVENLSVYTLEKKRSSSASFELIFKPLDGQKQRIRMIRKVMNHKNNIAHIKYESEPFTTYLNNGEFFFKYNNSDLGSAFVSEIAIDGLGNKITKKISSDKGMLMWGDEASKNTDRISQVKNWLNSNFKKIFKSSQTTQSNKNKHLDNDLLQTTPSIKNKHLNNGLLFWKKYAFGSNDKATLNSLIFRTENSGEHNIDLAPTWLAYPNSKSGQKTPLIVLLSDYNNPETSLELLGFSGRPEFDLTSELVEEGFAVLIVSPIIPDINNKNKENLYGKRVIKVINQILGKNFINHTNLNPGKIGVWGYGNATNLALRLSLEDPRIQASGFSRIDRICCPGKNNTENVRKVISNIGEHKTIIFEDKFTINNWKKLNPHKNIKFVEGKYNIISKHEKLKLYQFMKKQLVP